MGTTEYNVSMEHVERTQAIELERANARVKELEEQLANNAVGVLALIDDKEEYIQDLQARYDHLYASIRAKEAEARNRVRETLSQVRAIRSTYNVYQCEVSNLRGRAQITEEEVKRLRVSLSDWYTRTMMYLNHTYSNWRDEYSKAVPALKLLVEMVLAHEARIAQEITDEV